MEIFEKFDLSLFTGFKNQSIVQFYTAIRDISDIESLSDWLDKERYPFYLLGGGYNTLFVNNYSGLVIHNQLNSNNARDKSSIINDNTIEVTSSVIWDDFVAWTVENGFYGLENLSAIPGTVGGAIVQNIGAYGEEIANYVDRVQVYDLYLRKIVTLDKEQCQFLYRSSIFKSKPHWFIINVVLKLKIQFEPNIKYPGIAQWSKDRIEFSAKNLREYIINIRKQKLPDPDFLGNCGSFFKNPEISKNQLHELQARYQDIPHYSFGDRYKIPAAWLIEKAGWKGREYFGAAVYEKHALVIINKNKATGQQIQELALEIIQDVMEKFGIQLYPEVGIIESENQFDPLLG